MAAMQRLDHRGGAVEELGAEGGVLAVVAMADAAGVDIGAAFRQPEPQPGGGHRAAIGQHMAERVDQG
ncbi:hypothetical protein LTR94_037259, partial [Friedmanniomyces endolithicus]